MADDHARALRKTLIDGLGGHLSHIDFASAVKDFPEASRGVGPAGAPHSAWQLLEHMRIAQNDILEFSRNPKHKSPQWPDAYWPTDPEPPSKSAWNETIRAFEKDAKAMEQLVADLQNDLLEPFPHGDGQTLLREALLVATHNSYHLGQLVFIKKLSGGTS